MAKLGELFKQKFEKISHEVQEHSKHVNQQPVVGVVVPANGTHRISHDLANDFAKLQAQSLAGLKPERPVTFTPVVDESQVVGDLLDWLNDKGYLWRMEGKVRTSADRLTAAERDELQGAFFAFQTRRSEEL